MDVATKAASHLKQTAFLTDTEMDVVVIHPQTPMELRLSPAKGDESRWIPQCHWKNSWIFPAGCMHGGEEMKL